MFGSTYPTFHASDIVSDRIRDPDFAAYVRWEYLPADRARVILAASRRGIADRRRHRASLRARIARRLRTWIKATREARRGEPRRADGARSVPLLTAIEALQRESR